EIIYDGTVYFCNRFFKKYDRTIDQMVQAARSGKQTIAEASMASGTSKETEIKLTNVARASVEELLLDYEDFMRTHKIVKWDTEHRYLMLCDEVNETPDAKYETFNIAFEKESAEVCTNVMWCLISASPYLLNRQLKAMEQPFVEQGGLSQRMYESRTT